MLPGARGDPEALPLFGAAAPAPDDLVLHAGGPVWALDWCPAALPVPGGSDGDGARNGANGTAPAQLRYLAVGCHPADAALHRLGAPVEGPGVLQVWEVAGEGAGAAPPPPRLALALAHAGGVAWHARWCPAADLADAPAAAPAARGGRGAAAEPPPPPRLGLLAAALGDGAVRVYAVPQPRALAAAAGVAAAGAAPPPPLLLHLAPVAALGVARLGLGALPSLVDWLPAAPHDLLLVGCWDGSVAVARLAPSAGRAPGPGGVAAGGAELLAHFPADTLPLRAARWAPARGGGAPRAADLAHRHVFLTAGHEGSLKIWDARDQFAPLYAQQLTAGTVLDADWTGGGAGGALGVLAALEDASLKGVLLAPGEVERQRAAAAKAVFAIAWRGAGAGALWAVAAHPRARLAAYAGEDGVVGAFPVEYAWDHRRRRAHAPLGALRARAGGALELQTGAAAAAGRGAGGLRNGGLYDDRVVERLPQLAASGGELPAAAQALHRLAWAAAARGGAWLAAGGAAGVVRLQWVEFDE